MENFPDFITDLAIIMICAGVSSIIFKWCKQPVVLGYIVAGFIASAPFHISWIPNISNINYVNIWGQIGIIFLLFTLGLDFSFKKIMKVGGTALISALIGAGSMIIIGFIVGQLLGWSEFESIFLGGIISMSSTTIIVKALTDMNQHKEPFARLIFGELVIEDLLAVLMLVMLSTVAVKHNFEGTLFLKNILKLIFFILLWFVTGIFIIPTILKKIKKFLNPETLLIISIGLCLGMVLFAVKVGFSAALGAFIMGSILGETLESKQIETQIQPIKNLFGAVFFVSVGMMVDVTVIVQHPLLILLLVVVVSVGKTLFGTCGFLISGQSLKTSMRAGFCLGQIGEFSFIIVALGISLNVVNKTLYPIVIVASIITTFITPYNIKNALPAYNLAERIMPARWKKQLVNYTSASQNNEIENSNWKKLLTRLLRIMVIYLVISIAVMAIFVEFINPLIINHLPNIWGHIVASLLTFVFMSPFLRAFMMKKNRSVELKQLWSSKNISNRIFLILIFIFRVGVCAALVGSVLIDYFPHNKPIILLATIFVVIFIIFSTLIKKQSRRIEALFIENLNEKEIQEERNEAILPKVKNDLFRKKIDVEEIMVPQLSPIAGKLLKEINLNKKSGISIMAIIRGNLKINIPGGDERIFPFDKLVLAGDKSEIARFSNRIISTDSLQSEVDSIHHISLLRYQISETSPLNGKMIKECGVREESECMIIEIQKQNESLINIQGDIVLETGDIVWIAGEVKNLEEFKELFT